MLLAPALLASFYLTSNLMDNLRSSAYMSLSVNLVQVRTFCYLALGLGSLLWYAYALNEIKRECFAVPSLEGSEMGT